MAAIQHYKRLESLREQLETQLFFHEERRCFGNDDVEDGTALDLRLQIRDLSRELCAMKHEARLAG